MIDVWLGMDLKNRHQKNVCLTEIDYVLKIC